jgi:serine/threonine-protein kinase RsbW
MDQVSETRWPAGTVTLSVPAHRDFVSGIRAITRSAAALCDLTVDDIEDLQMAVDEAATLLLPLVDADDPPQISANFEVTDGVLRIRLSVPRRDDLMPDRSGLAWAMLAALDETATISAQGATVSITISRSREGASL